MGVGVSGGQVGVGGVEPRRLGRDAAWNLPLKQAKMKKKHHFDCRDGEHDGFPTAWVLQTYLESRFGLFSIVFGPPFSLPFLFFG